MHTSSLRSPVHLRRLGYRYVLAALAVAHGVLLLARCSPR